MKQDYPHFRRLWNRVVIALMGAAFIPLIVIGGIFSFYSVSIFKDRTVEMLVHDTDTRRRQLDSLFSDRVATLKLVAQMPADILTVQEQFDAYARTVIEKYPWINDLEVFDIQGNQLVHQGHLARETRNYADRTWFQRAGATGVWISDLELGYRQVPHVSIAVRREKGPPFLIVRASLNGGDLQRQLQPSWKAFTATDVFLIDQKGDYQARLQPDRPLMVASGLGQQQQFDGVTIQTKQEHLQLTTWLSSVPWVLGASYKPKEVFAPALEMRYFAIWSLVLGGVVICSLVLLTADSLVKRLETKRQRIHHLNAQMQRSSYMASTMELGIGFLEEITDRLASITVAAEWLESHLSGENASPVAEDLKQIRESAVTGRKRLKQFLENLRPRQPVITDVQPVDLIQTVVTWLKKELALRCIRVVWDIDEDVPAIRTEPGKLRHAFQNILLNALTAVDRHGEIHIDIKDEGPQVAVTITDSGCGIGSEDRERIFEPLFTTKTDGTGLGLPVARDIFQALGGSLILLRSSSEGTAFRMVLPKQFHGFADADRKVRTAKDS
ncbi:ATP-binding protein [uncultured Desulfosarcina sp.]|uniref:ATP-binding protein n=1 Tax=uncultured Desulfosarcina sp. TaxID=218289 RepID=UPI0029C64303|nr:ATP-binding protein [uncultured Desulfosarcina sp.]